MHDRDFDTEGEPEQTAGQQIGSRQARIPSWHVQADATAESRGGLYSGFETYRTIPRAEAQAEYRALLTSGTVVPDANVLLDLYRYNSDTRDDLLGVLNGIRDQLWVPHQVMTEFWRNREDVILDRRGTRKIIGELRAQLETVKLSLQIWARAAALPKEQADGLIALLASAFNTVTDRVRAHADPDAKEIADNTEKDPVLVTLNAVLEDRVGLAFNATDHKEALAEAARRIAAQEPPGYKDAGKKGNYAAGDYLVWAQVLREARSLRRDVLFVTRDNKEDWWRKEHGRARGPRPELVNEMGRVAGVRLLMIRPEDLLVLGSEVLKIAVRAESVEDMKRVSSAVAVAWNVEHDIHATRDQLALVLEEQARYRDMVAREYPADPGNIRSAGALRGLSKYVRERPDYDTRLQRIAATLEGDTSLIGVGENWHHAVDKYGFHSQLDLSDALDMLADALEEDQADDDN